MGYPESASPLRNLLIRIESGVKEELLPLISLRGIGRVRARALHTSGYRTIDDLRRASPTELSRIAQIGPETIKSIKEQVGGTVSKEEWSDLSKKKGSKQMLIDFIGAEEGDEAKGD
jgi:helicase